MPTEIGAIRHNEANKYRAVFLAELPLGTAADASVNITSRTDVALTAADFLGV